MSWTKRQLITQAFEEIGLAAFAFDLTPAQMQSALRRLDSMMASWAAKGLALGYPTHTNPDDSDLDEDSLIPESANEAVYLNLGPRIAPAFGKVVAMEVKTNAKQALDTLYAANASMTGMSLGVIPLGAGSRLQTFSTV